MRTLATISTLLLLLASPTLSDQQNPPEKFYASVQVRLPKAAGAVARKSLGIFERQIRSRCGAKVGAGESPAAGGLLITLDLDPTLGAEGFRIEGSGAALRVSGECERALIYGLGKLLRSSRFSPEGFAPGPWRGASVPQKPVRGIYFASHFHNFYQEAPLPEVFAYIEDLALWGTNNVAVWFDMHEFKSVEDPKAANMIARLKAILKAAKETGLDTTLLCLANESWADSPVELRADWTGGHDGYTRELQGHYHVELCPSKPGALAKILEWRQQVFKALASAPMDFMCIWPYDQGGCTCAQCKPWGANGLMHIAQPMAEMFRKSNPTGKVIFSTWYFDDFTTGEWDGLKKLFLKKPDWADYLMVGDYFGVEKMRGGVPGALPTLSFPEISMWGVGGWGPWGGFGASPYPGLLEERWHSKGALLVGGFPYSEGIFEDMNKAVYSQFYWQADRKAEDTLREYVAFEFSPEVADGVTKAALLMEKTLTRKKEVKDGQTHFILENPQGVDEIKALMEAAHQRLSPAVQKSWRWRILYLRAIIDHELAHHDSALTDRAEEALQEITKLYHAQNAAFPVAPPTREAIKANRQL